jgi:hypothetical protein
MIKIRKGEKKMKFVAEYYLVMVKGVTTEVIEAEDIKGAVDEAEGKETDYKILVNVNEI